MDLSSSGKQIYNEMTTNRCEGCGAKGKKYKTTCKCYQKKKCNGCGILLHKCTGDNAYCDDKRYYSDEDEQSNTAWEQLELELNSSNDQIWNEECNEWRQILMKELVKVKAEMNMMEGKQKLKEALGKIKAESTANPGVASLAPASFIPSTDNSLT